MHEPALNNRSADPPADERPGRGPSPTDQTVPRPLRDRLQGQDSWAAVTGRHLYLLTDSRYTEQAEKECPTCRIVERTRTLAQTAGYMHLRPSSGSWPWTVRSAWPTGPGQETLKAASRPSLIRCPGPGDQRAWRDPVYPKGRPDRPEGPLAGLSSFARDHGECLGGSVGLYLRRLGAMTAFDTIIAFGRMPPGLITIQPLEGSDPMIRS